MASTSSSFDDGPRRWLVGGPWDDDEIRRIEELTERAGFIDVTVDPSPVALARVVDEQITHVRRDARTDESFEFAVHVGATGGRRRGRIDRTDGPVARSAATAEFSTGWFDGIARADHARRGAAQVRRRVG